MILWGSRVRRYVVGFLGLALLAACGASVTITLPGGSRQVAAPSGYQRLYSPAPYAFRYSGEGEPVRRGRRSERFELRDGDCGGSDCGNYRARAEITEDRERTKARLDRDIWFGWSFYNETVRSVDHDRYLGTVVGQWKLDGEQPSIFRLVQIAPEEADWESCDPSVCTLTGRPTDDVVVELDEMTESMGWSDAQNDGRVCRLFGMEANLGRWVDIVVNTNFGTDEYGYLRIWVNGELRCNYMGQLVSAERARTQIEGPTNRRGIFNSFTRRWTQNFGTAPKPTMVVYYDEFLTGRSRAEVDPELRAAQGLAPVD